MSVIIKSKIKEYATIEGKDKPLNVSSDLADHLDKVVQDLIKKACWRAKENGRNTVMAKDL